MKLFYTPGVCSLAPHILLREADAGFTLDKVGAGKRTEDGRDYLAINPHGYVPALEIEPGLSLTEGPAIMQYLADRYPTARLAPENGSLQRYQLQSWLNFITSELHKNYSALFKPLNDEAKALFKDIIEARLDYVEQTLASQDYLLADHGYSAADVYLFVVVSWSRFVGIDLARWPALSAHHQRIAARPTVQAALQAEGLAQAA